MENSVRIKHTQQKIDVAAVVEARSLTKIIAVTSGKGGVGKTNVSSNLAIALAQQGARVCIFDADTSLANINIVMGLSAQYTIAHLLNGEKSMDDILIEGPQGISIVPSASGISECANLNNKQRQRLITALAELEDRFDYLLIDTAAGLGREVVDFVRSAQYVLLVITPEPTSLTDTFALIRILQRQGCKRPLYAVVSQANDYSDSWKVFSRFQGAVKKYLKTNVNYLGYIGDDRNLKAAVCEQRPVLLYKPNTHASRCFKVLANVVKKQFSQGGQHHSFSEYWRMLSAIRPVPANIKKINNTEKPQSQLPVRPVIKAEATASPVALMTEELVTWLADDGTSQEEAARNLKAVTDVYIKRFQRLPYKPDKYLAWLVENKHYSEAETRKLLQQLEVLFIKRYRHPVYDLETMLAPFLNSLGLPVELTNTLKESLRQKSQV